MKFLLYKCMYAWMNNAFTYTVHTVHTIELIATLYIHTAYWLGYYNY